MMSVAPAPPQPSEPLPDAPIGGEDLLGVRIAAALIDLALLTALFAVLAALIGESTLEERAFSFSLGGAGFALYLALVLVYYLVFELTVGQTVGKLLLGLRVVRTDGSRPPVTAIIVRTLLRVVDWLPALYLVGFIVMLATGARRQRLGDLAARTSLARARPIPHRGLAAATVAVVVVVLAGVSFYLASGENKATDPFAEPANGQEAVREGAVLLRDDFSDPTSGWETAELAEGELGYVDGAYRILVQQAGRQAWADRRGDARVQALRLEFETTQLSGTGGDLVGARCYTDVDSNTGYMVGIAPVDQGYAVVKFERDDFSLLESSGEAVASINRLRQENQLRIECVAQPDGSIVVTLAVNGRALVRAEDDTGAPEFDAVGLFVDTTNGGAEALFDDLVVTEVLPT